MISQSQVTLPAETDGGKNIDLTPLVHRVAVLESLATAFWVFDIDDSKVVWCNSAGLRLWNAGSLEELAQRDMSLDMTPAVTEQLKFYQSGFDRNKTYEETWTLYPKGDPVTCLLRHCGILLDNGRMAMLVEAIGESPKSDPVNLRGLQALLHTSVMISLYDEKLNLIYSNPAARRMLPTDFRHLSEHFADSGDYAEVSDQIYRQAEYQTERLVNTTEGETWHQLTFQLNPDSITGKTDLIVSESNVTSRLNAERRAHALAYTDTLTGLPNRTFLNEAFAREIKYAEANAQKMAVLFVDLNRFKIINDSLGHSIGDELLRLASGILKESLRHSDIIARLGGDEFLIVMPNIPTDFNTNQLAQRMLDSLSSPLQIGAHEVSISASVGVAIYPDDGEDAECLIQHADVAMYKAKELGTNSIRRFDVSMQRNMKERVQLEVDLRRAIEQQQFELYFQPRLSAENLQATNAEALIRWNHPEAGHISPLVFIPLAEETGMITEIGDWVIEDAVRQCTQWRNAGFDLAVSVNVSSRQFSSGNLTEKILSVLKLHHCPAQCLELEITESMLVRETDSVRQTLNQLRDTGVKIAIDDFGTGYSNLRYLQEFPINKLKIDRSFIMDEQYRALVEMTVSLGKLLKLEVVAEGIETEKQATWLRSLGCDEFQGYYFSKPLPAAEFVSYLSSQQLPASSVPQSVLAG